MGFSLVQADLGTPLHGRVQRPVDHEEGALDAADFAQRRGEVVTARVGGQLAQDQTRGDRAYRAAIIFRDAAGRPTSQAKGVRQAPGHPTGTGSFERFRKNWWGVRARRQADSRIPSNGAVFSARQSLHMTPYRKVCRPAGYVVTDASGILLAQDGGMISPGNATPLTVCIYERKVRCQPLLQIAFDSIGGSVLSFPRRTTAPRQTQPEGRWLHLVFVARVAGFTSDD